MKAHNYWVRLGLASLLWLGLSGAALSAREYYEAKEVFGSLLKVDLDKHYLKVDRGPAHKVMLFKWTSKTRFRDSEKRILANTLKEGQRVRVFYSDDKKKTGRPEPVASKVIVNPVSTPNDRKYDQ
jgi:hypothetical protein